MLSVLDDAVGVANSVVTTIHSHANDQNLLDGPHQDPRRARSAAVNLIPTSTGAAVAVGEVLPALAGNSTASRCASRWRTAHSPT